MAMVAACTQPGAGAAPDAGLPMIAALTSPDSAPEALFFPSRRCGECHGRQRSEWSASAHARSAQGSFEQAVALLGNGGSARCEGCHLPLAEAGARISDEGVGCDACHTAVGRAPAPRVLALAPERATRFGPFRDAKDHSFHKVAFSGFVVEGELCQACHQDPEDRPVPEYTTVSEWRAVKDHVDCPTCHMPGFEAAAAKGERLRPVSRHDFAPDKARALAAALDLRVAVRHGEATVDLENTGADHALPTGRPERRLRLELEWKDAAGKSVRREEEVFGRTLVDAAGALAPSFDAIREQSDHRLVPNARWERRFEPVPGARTLAVRVVYDRFDRALAPRLGPASPVVVLERREAL